MMSSNRRDYGSAREWLSALRQDEAWLHQQQKLMKAASGDIDRIREDAIRRIGRGETFEFWDIYEHEVEPVVSEVWEIAELTLVKLKIQTIGMLSIEWLEHRQETTGTAAPKGQKKTAAKKREEKPVKPRELMTFHRKSSVLDGHLTLLFNEMVKDEWIGGNEADFIALFSNKPDEDCVLTWNEKYGKGTLVELFKQMVASELIIVPDGFNIPAILEGHFRDKAGQWLTGLDKGNSAHPKALPFIQKYVRLIRISPRSGYDDDEEDFQSQYDPYDHQDLNLHKR